MTLLFLPSVATAKTTCCSWERKEKKEKKEKYGVRRAVGGQRDELVHC